MVKGGSRDYIVGQFRYARVLEFKEFVENAGWLKKALHKKLAFKITASYMEANDWEATDNVANKYGVLEVEDLDIGNIMREEKTTLENKKEDGTITLQEQDDLDDLTALLDGYIGLVSPGVF